MRISDWSSDVGSSDLDVELAAIVVDRARAGRRARILYDLFVGQIDGIRGQRDIVGELDAERRVERFGRGLVERCRAVDVDEEFRPVIIGQSRSEEHTSELQSLMRISYAVFCLKKKKQLQT